VIKEAIIRFHRADVARHARYLARTPFYSGYWAPARIGSAIRRFAHLASGRLLDVGCGNKPYAAFFDGRVSSYVGLEYSPESGFFGNKADLAGDAMRLPFADETFDAILCTEVLEHLPDPEAAIAEFARVLRPDGLLLVTVPLIFPIHDQRDFFRFTDRGMAAMMSRNGIEVSHSEPLSGGGITCAMLLNLYFYDLLFLWNKGLYAIGLLLRPFLLILVFLINIAGWIFDRIFSSPQMAFNHLTVGRRK
jgi:SAM-dependent methyltransferase